VSELSFVNNIAAGVNAVGVRNAPIVWGLARVDWQSVQDRDAFFAWVGQDDGE
jgi:hypothetical protein